MIKSNAMAIGIGMRVLGSLRLRTVFGSGSGMAHVVYTLWLPDNTTPNSKPRVGVQFLVKVLNESKLISKGSKSKPTKLKKKARKNENEKELKMSRGRQPQESCNNL